MPSFGLRNEPGISHWDYKGGTVKSQLYLFDHHQNQCIQCGATRSKAVL